MPWTCKCTCTPKIPRSMPSSSLHSASLISPTPLVSATDALALALGLWRAASARCHLCVCAGHALTTCKDRPGQCGNRLLSKPDSVCAVGAFAHQAVPLPGEGAGLPARNLHSLRAAAWVMMCGTQNLLTEQ